MMAEKIRVGLVGANSATGSWGARSHVPALHALPEYELLAVATAHEETAQVAAAEFGARLAFSDYHALVAHPEVDLVAVNVRVPYHREIVLAAIGAGKDVFCEWPLGANLAEAEEMATAADQRGVRTFIGLQGRSDPTLLFLRRLLADGYVGEILACNLAVIGTGGIERPASRIWAADRTNGVGTLAIQGGHTLDSFCFSVGEFADLSAIVATRLTHWPISGSSEIVAVTSPDTVVLSGHLAGGAVVAAQIASVPFNGSGARLEIFGTKGTLLLTSASGFNIGPTTLYGGQTGATLAPIEVPSEFVLVPEGTPAGTAYNVAQAYARYVDSMQAGERFDADFGLAVRRHRLLDAIERSSASGSVTAPER
jgi:predicted dehydrogenase